MDDLHPEKNRMKKLNTVKTDAPAKIKADNIFFFNNGKLPCHRCIKLKRGQHTRTRPEYAQGDSTVPRGASIPTRSSWPMPTSCKAGCEWQRNDLKRAHCAATTSPAPAPVAMQRSSAALSST
jgi:hypothetical protein